MSRIQLIHSARLKKELFRPTDKVQLLNEAIWLTDFPIKKYVEEGQTETHFSYTSGKHFSTKRYALLFAPGEYRDCDFQVGYYVQVIGLGKCKMLPN